MNALFVLYGGNLSKYAFEPLINGKNSVDLAIEQAQKFPEVGKIVFLAGKEPAEQHLRGRLPSLNEIEIIQNDCDCGHWTKKNLLEKIACLQTGFDAIYFAWADCPFLDPALAKTLAKRHLDYNAEYSYADGFPYGAAPEILSPGTAGILAKILDKDGCVERDMLFSVIQKDINAFDIEAEISRVDLSCHRLNLCADSKRNFRLLENFLSAADNKIPSADVIEKIVLEQPQILRTLPIFYPIQVYGGCSGACTLCPYPLFTNAKERKDFMDIEKFEPLLDKIIEFSGDAVIDLSLWGELGMHPQKLKLIEAVLRKSGLSLVIETSGLGWNDEELEKCKTLYDELKADKKLTAQGIPPLSWIVSLDTADSSKYTELRGGGLAAAEACAKKLLTLFPENCYVQAVRIKGSEDDTEKFYRYWKETAPNGENNIIIQKYDDFCGQLEKKQASDISPVIRQNCWHIIRDMPILIDGNVPLCREELSALKGDTNRVLGNVFNDSLESIWLNGENYYKEQCKKNYTGLCLNCDEYYTYNF